MRMAEARHADAPAAMIGHDRFGFGLRSIGRLDDPRDQPRRLLHRSREMPAHSEEPGRHGALQRVGRRQIGQARRDRVRGHAVIHEGHENSIEHSGLSRRWPPPGDQEVKRFGEGHRAHDLVHEIMAPQNDSIGGRFAQSGGQWLVHLRACSSRCGSADWLTRWSPLVLSAQRTIGWIG